jgi:hypothetical protein
MAVCVFGFRQSLGSALYALDPVRSSWGCQSFTIGTLGLMDRSGQVLFMGAFVGHVGFSFRSPKLAPVRKSSSYYRNISRT